MFSAGFRAQKLKTSLRLSISKLQLIQKKKTEMALKARKEIADIIRLNKYDCARIRVEHIIREDYTVEVLERIEMYCDLLLARFPLIENKRYCDDGLIQAVTSLIWVFPHISSDIPELKKTCEQLALKYGKEFTQQAKLNSNCTVDDSLIIKLSPSNLPSKLLKEKYLIEIARNFGVHFKPDQSILDESDPKFDPDDFPPSPTGGSSPNGNDGNCACLVTSSTQTPLSLTNEHQMYCGKRLEFSNEMLSSSSGQEKTKCTSGHVTLSGSTYLGQDGGQRSNLGKSDGIEELTRRFKELKKR